jgi:hypothetical protein
MLLKICTLNIAFIATSSIIKSEARTHTTAILARIETHIFNFMLTLLNVIKMMLKNAKILQEAEKERKKC